MRSMSLTGRVFLALLLMIGFYVLALSLAAFLFFVPIAEYILAKRVHIQLALGCWVAGGVIVWSILPRLDRFVAPGPLLKPEQHPQLFAVLDSVANATRQKMPTEVYLTAEFNAWVTQRGGLMGLGGRRVMGLGLPLLQSLTVSQTRAVIAHEFGHFYGGDVRLGPWIYKTRGAIERTLLQLHRRDSLLKLPFLWYGKMFMRITQAVSRQQEFTADALAVRVAGAQVHADGLRAVYAGARAFDGYWYGEVASVLNAGFRPPIAEGFQAFMSVADVQQSLGDVLDREIAEGKTSPYDSHPSLRERLAAIEVPERVDPPAADPAALTLIHDASALELELLAALADDSTARALQPIEWDEVGEKVYFPRWEAVVKQYASALPEVKVETLPEVVTKLADFGRRLGDPLGATPPQERARKAAGVLGTALALILKRQGWTFHIRVGEAVVGEYDGMQLQPFSIIPDLADGQLTAEAWQQQCAAAHLTGMQLNCEVNS